MSLFNFCLNVCLIFSKCIKFGNVLSKIVVKLGELNLGDSVDLYLEGSILACEILSVILGGEGNVNVKFLVDALANDLLLKSGNEGTGAELKSVISALAALKCNAVAEAFKIDNGGIAKLCSSVGNVDLTGVLLMIFSLS